MRKINLGTFWENFILFSRGKASDANIVNFVRLS